MMILGLLLTGFSLLISTKAEVPFSFSSSFSGDHDPMVAFLCNHPSVHTVAGSGWVKDDSTNCLKDPVDILNYCRQMYPKMDVWNIVEASELVTIKNWCNFGHGRCRNKFSIRPYRCLVGAFESEALQVPEGCQFDLVHDSGECKSYEAWNQTTSGMCANRSQVLHTFSILQPCAVDGFGGAEFVCCPSAPSVTTGNSDNNGKRGKPEKKPRVVHRSTELTSRTTVGTTTLLATPEPLVSTSSGNGDAYTRYLRIPADPTLTEHEYFVRAKADLEKQHHERVTKMMKEWATARHRVQEIKKQDMKGGEKFNREMTARFQKAYESLEREDVQRKKQLNNLHQQRVQAELSQRKRQAMDEYMEALRDEEPDATTILKALIHYIKIEQKDRIHAISHYQHTQESDPVEAETIRAEVADHLRGIDERVTQAINMLSQVSKFEKKIRTQIEKFLSQYQSLDESLSVIMAKIDEQSNAKKPSTEFSDDIAPPTTPSASTDLLVASESKTDNNYSDIGIVITQASTEQSSSNSASSASSSSSSSFSASSSSSSDDDETSTAAPKGHSQTTVASPSGHHHDVEILPNGQHAAANVDKNDLIVFESYIKKQLPGQSGSTSSRLGAPIAIAVGGVAVLVGVFIGIAVLRKRTTGAAPAAASQNITEVDHRPVEYGTVKQLQQQKPNPTQMNGYENPTYQYYAAAATAAPTANA